MCIMLSRINAILINSMNITRTLVSKGCMITHVFPIWLTMSSSPVSATAVSKRAFKAWSSYIYGMLRI